MQQLKRGLFCDVLQIAFLHQIQCHYHPLCILSKQQIDIHVFITYVLLPIWQGPQALILSVIATHLQPEEILALPFGTYVKMVPKNSILKEFERLYLILDWRAIHMQIKKISKSLLSKLIKSRLSFKQIILMLYKSASRIQEFIVHICS